MSPYITEVTSKFSMHCYTNYFVSTRISAATPDIDYAAIPLVLSPGVENSNSGRLCFSFAIFDDDIVEPDECIAISIDIASDAVVIAENGTNTVLCITDNGNLSLVAVSQA